MNYIDIIVLIFIGLLIFEGYKKGLVKMLFELVGLILAFILSKNYCYLIENFFTSKTKFYITIHDFFQKNADWISDLIETGKNNNVSGIANSLKLPQEMKMLIINSNQNGSILNFDSFVNTLTDFVMKSISFLITFLIIYLLLLIICNIIDMLVKLPVLNLTNKVTGCIVGFAKGLISLYLVFAIASPIIAFIPNNKFIVSIKESQSSNIFYENNIVLNYLSYKGFYDTNNENNNNNSIDNNEKTE